MPGRTQAAKNEAPTRPAANMTIAYSPAKGTSALAASAAVSILVPSGRTLAVVSTMNQAMVCETMAPEILSARWPGMSSASRFFSTMLLETIKIM